MSHAPNLFRLLEAAWNQDATGPRARAAVAIWAQHYPVLECFRDPLALVEHCQRRQRDEAHRRDVQALLAAVVSFAGADEWAARTVLQAVLPGLAAVCRRASGYIGGQVAVWQCIDELDQQVVATACERIAALAPDPPQEVATAVVDSTWQRVRAYALAEQRNRARRSPLGEYAEDAFGCAAPHLSPAEELAAALVDAVQTGVLQRVDAAIVYSSRIAGRDVAELAPILGRNPHWLCRRRQRVEELLLAEAAGRPSARLAATLAS